MVLKKLNKVDILNVQQNYFQMIAKFLLIMILNLYFLRLLPGRTAQDCKRYILGRLLNKIPGHHFTETKPIIYKKKTKCFKCIVFLIIVNVYIYILVPTSNYQILKKKEIGNWNIRYNFKVIFTFVFCNFLFSMSIFCKVIYLENFKFFFFKSINFKKKKIVK